MTLKHINYGTEMSINDIKMHKFYNENNLK